MSRIQVNMQLDTNDLADADDLADATPCEIADLYQSEADVPSAAAESPDNRPPNTLVDQVKAEGLYLDYFAKHPFGATYLLTPPASTVFEDLDDWLELQPGHEAIGNGLAGNGERWDVDKESAGFLASLMALGKDDDGTLAFESERPRLSEFKIEEPILRCDPLLELHRLRNRNTATISTRGMVPFALDAERDESIKWPSTRLTLPAQQDKMVGSEKLEIDRDVITFLHDIARPPLTSEAEMMQANIDADKPNTLRPETPPLLPLSPPLSPQPFSAALMELELTSTPEHLMAAEAAELERMIMENDERTVIGPFGSQEPREADTTSPYSSLRTPRESSSSPTKRKRLFDYQADVPLLPAESTPKRPKTTSFPDGIRTLIPLPESDTSVMDPEVAAQDLDRFTNDILVPLAEPAVQQAENEQLVEVDTTMRVPIPHIDSHEVAAPWRQYGGIDIDSQSGLLAYTKRELLNSEAAWPGVSKLERTLGWSPFPARLGKATLHEDFDDDKSSTRYLKELNVDEPIDINELVAKAEGLRILDSHDSDDDELESVLSKEDEEEDISGTEPKHSPLPGPPPRLAVQQPTTQKNAPNAPTKSNRLELSALLQRRKLELDGGSKIIQPNVVAEVTNLQPSKSESQRRGPDATLKPSPVSNLLRNGGISGFMQLHGGIARPPIDMKPRAPKLPQPAAPPAVMVVPVAETSLKHTVAPKMPLPSLSDMDRPMQVVLTTQLLSNRAFIRQLQALLPGLDFIERDHSQRKAQSCKPQALDDAEADITVSPGVGLLLTTLQKLKQKPLPGQTDFCGIRDRIAAMSLRYERLVVFISDGQQHLAQDNMISSSLDDRDCEAITDLTGFATSLEADVELRFVPGGEDNLVRWVAAAMSQHDMGTNEDTRLLQEETTWERFLRATGMNSFAAQTTMSTLKRPDSTLSSDISSTTRSSADGSFGLARFVRMSAEQRAQRLGAVLGGDRVLSHVSKAVDGGWLSGADRMELV